MILIHCIEIRRDIPVTRIYGDVMCTILWFVHLGLLRGGLHQLQSTWNAVIFSRDSRMLRDAAQPVRMPCVWKFFFRPTPISKLV